MFKNTTKTNFDSTLTFNLVHASKLVIVYEVLLFVIGMISALLFIFDDLFVGIAIIVLILIIMLIFPMLNKAMLKKFLRKAMDKSPIQDESTSNDFVFSEDHMEITSTKNGEAISNIKLEYKLMVKAVEYKDYLYLYTGVNLAYILDKEGMTLGDFHELKEFLRGKLVSRYKKRSNLYF